MQQKDKRTELLAKTIGKIIKNKRLSLKKSSINKFAHEYDLDVGNISRIENGVTDIKLVTLWRIAEALEIAPSEILSLAEKKLGKKFYLNEL